ncbi:CAP domain-containing protein [Patescibacteria group bacterium]|nr:CAP domain-containing protein [Patescibacteria group bacterium]
MIKNFKKYFIPNKGNSHKPRILRWKVALVILSFILFVEVCFLVQVLWFIPQGNFFASVAPMAIEGFTNQNRLSNNLESLKTNSLLEKAAQLKAEDMATKGYFAHTSPEEGLTPWYWLDKVGYEYVLAGENLAINFVDSQDAINAWMNSPTHKANILNNNFVEIGVGAAKEIYEGKETIFIVQLFGRPVTMTAQSVAVAQEKKQSVPPTVEISNESIVGDSTAVKGEVKNSIMPDDSGFVGLVVRENLSPSIVSRFLSTPRAISNYFYFVLFTILALALLLSIFIKIKIQHPALIVNGVVLLIVISAIIWINQYIVFAQAKII